MFDFDEIMRQAQHGEATDNLAKAFDLSQQQTQAALDMILPAMAEGYRHNAQNMNMMAGFFDSLAGGRHTNYFQNAADAFSQNARGDGNDILGNIFGSKEMSRAVAAQTSAFAGISADIVKKMLPVIAAIVTGGMQNQTREANPFEAILKQFGSAIGSGSGNNPFGPMMDEFLKQMSSGQRSAHETAAPETNKKADDSFGGLFEEMFRTGRKVQDTQAEALGQIFDQFNKQR